MTVLRPLLLLLISLPVAACSAGSSGGPDAPDGPDGTPGAPDARPGDEPDADPTPPSLATFRADAAEAVCGALLRCCDDADVTEYFAAYAASELLVEFRDRLPPRASLDEAGCRDVVAEMIDVVPFGDWIRAAERGDVAFDAGAFAGCLAALDDAACGAETRAALYDGTCLGFAPPGGGDEQRRMFHRTAGVGASCAPLRDGVGAAFFGTCDPTAAFCCYADADEPGLGCTYPFDGDGAARAGTCAAVSATSAACSSALPLQLCATGASCDPDTQRCVEDGAAALAVGQECVDDGFNLLGDCVDSYCDLLGTSRCEPLKADGQGCSAGYECQGGACAGGACGPLTSCDGVEPTSPDAGVPDAGEGDAGVPDAASPDAAPAPDAPAADGETCGGAFDLFGASAPSAIAGYDHVVTGAFGASNDYNPYEDASPQLPPACSIIYDAGGNDVVYQLVLDPGQTLKMRYAVAPTSVAGGIYLLDACTPSVDWPDHDGSGACGNNEYRSNGYCGYLGCDPLEWTFTYPTVLDGAPTSPRTFWVVVDHLAGAPTGYQLDFAVY